MGTSTAGWQSSEFWKSLIPQVFSLLVLLHVVAGADAITLQDTILKGVEAVFALSGSVAVAMKYIESRTRVKEAIADVEATKAANHDEL